MRQTPELIFQFRKGAIKRLHKTRNHTIKDTFNSVKVRLRVNKLYENFNVDGFFQFRKGAIKRPFVRGLGSGGKAFNSVKVRLRERWEIHRNHCQRAFNSVKVRLRGD